MKVWLAEWSHRAEGGGVIGVYSYKPTVDYAREALRKMHPSWDIVAELDHAPWGRPWGEVTVEEYEVEYV